MIPFKNEEGATLIFVAISLFMIMGFAALAIDGGLGFNERRQDQAAADAAVMAAALSGGMTNDQIVATVRDYANANLTNGQVFDLTDWAACTDPDRMNFPPLVFTPIVASGITYDCISVTSGTHVRVKLPTTSVSTTFGRVLGVNSLDTSAAAIALITPDGTTGIRPFGLVAGTGPGSNCLVTGPAGPGVPPCDGPTTGNFFRVDSPFIGADPSFGTTRTCSGALQLRYKTNVAQGLDHTVYTWPVRDEDNNPTGDFRDLVTDDCDNGFPTQLNVAAGNGLDLADGLYGSATYGPGTPSLLRQGTGATMEIRDGAATMNLDNVPLWDYLATNAGACAASNFGPAVLPEDRAANMDLCLASGPTFTADIADSPRLVWVPRFREATYPTGTSEVRTIDSFEPAFLDALYFNCSAVGCGLIFYPGSENHATVVPPLCDPTGAACKSLGLTQLTSYVLDRSMLPGVAIPSNGPPTGTIFNGVVELWR